MPFALTRLTLYRNGIVVGGGGGGSAPTDVLFNGQPVLFNGQQVTYTAPG